MDINLKGKVIDFTIHHYAPEGNKENDCYHIIIHEMTKKGYVVLHTLILDYFANITNLLTLGYPRNKKKKVN